MDEIGSLGAWLKQRRKVLDLTQEELARKIGCATVTLQKIEEHAKHLGAGPGVQVLRADAEEGTNNARWLRERQAKERLLAEVVRQGAGRFRGRG